jgi:hypothetical protein
MSRLLGNFVLWLMSVALVATAGVAAGWALYTHKTTGVWRLPSRTDLGHAAKNLVGVEEPAPKVVYLHRGAITLKGGARDDATRNVSGIVGRTGKQEVRLRGYRGSDAQWKRIVSCVRATFRPFDIEFVEERPESDDYFMVTIGSRPRDIGYKDSRVGGLAPFNGTVIPDAVVFVFADSLGNRRRAICNTIAEEVGHAYGLDHIYDCSDVMTYLPDCGPKYFRDKDMPCGEHEERACIDGSPTQNTYQRLANLVGLRQQRVASR